jgi:energy-coupling factor transport system permease protein
MKSFESWHPLGLIIYFIAILSVVMFSTHPLLLITAFLGGLFYYVMLEKLVVIIRNIAMFLGFFMLITLTNPFFSKEGVTVLFFMNNRAVTGEALLYGMNMAVMIIAVILWFKIYIRIVDLEKFMFLFGRLFPGLALLISMSVGFIPVFVRRTKSVLQAQKGMGMYPAGRYLQKVRTAVSVFSVVITWSLESAVDTADSMKARGYGLKGRTQFSVFRFGAPDRLLLILTIILFSAVIWGIASGRAEFLFYPRVSYTRPDVGSKVFLIAYACLAFLPGVIEIKERVKWKYYLSEI